MLYWTRSAERRRLEGLLRSQASAEFKLDGTLVNANAGFLNLLGYRLDEIRGRHHSLFVDPAEAASAAYQDFWDTLRRGEAQSAEFVRRAKDGTTRWIRGSYNPILDRRGRPCRILKIATDTTDCKQRDLDRVAQLEALHRSQAVIEFDVDGQVLAANDAFLSTFGYTAEGPRGLLSGKAYLLLSSGGVYAQGPFAPNDHLATYLEAILRFLGISDIETIRAEGIAYGPEQDQAAMARASEQIGAVSVTA